MVPKHAAAQADGLQVQRDDQVVQRPAHHAAQFINNTYRCRIARRCRRQQGLRISKPLGCKAPFNGIARHQRLYIAEVAAAAKRISVIADKHVAGMARIAVLAAQRASINTQSHANASAPSDVGAVLQPAQGTPAPLGLQGGDAIVFNPYVAEMLHQRRL